MALPFMVVPLLMIHNMVLLAINKFTIIYTNMYEYTIIILSM